MPVNVTVQAMERILTIIDTYRFDKHAYTPVISWSERVYSTLPSGVTEEHGAMALLAFYDYNDMKNYDVLVNNFSGIIIGFAPGGRFKSGNYEIDYTGESFVVNKIE